MHTMENFKGEPAAESLIPMSPTWETVCTLRTSCNTVIFKFWGSGRECAATDVLAKGGKPDKKGCWALGLRTTYWLWVRVITAFHGDSHAHINTHSRASVCGRIKHLLKGMFCNNKNQWESQSSHWGLENNKGIQYIFKTSKCQIIFSSFHFLMQCNQWAVNDWFISLSASFPVSQTGQVR